MNSADPLTLSNIPAFPEMINIEVTTACQLHCVYCPRDDMTRTHGEMSPDLFKKIVDECLPRDTRLWLHYMGDPLLHSGIYEMIRYAKDAGLSTVGMSTNVLLLNRSAAQQLIDSGLDRLELSIDGADKEGYLQLRAADRFDKVVRNAKTFFAVRNERSTQQPQVTLSFMSTPENQRDWEKINTMWKPYLSSTDFIMGIDPHSFAGTMGDGSAPPNPPATRTPCPSLWRSSLILWDGSMTICAMDSDGKTALGTVADETILSLWSSAQLNALRERHVNKTLDPDSLCYNCTDWQLLQAGYANVKETESPDEPTVK